MPDGATFARWKADPCAFIREVLVDPETGQPFDLYPAQERCLREALTLTADGRLPYPELVFAAPKKSGKTATAALVVIYVVVVLGGPFAEAYCAANDLEQAAGRVFQAVVRILEASPRLRDAVKATGGKVEFLSTGATITALASDPRPAATQTFRASTSCGATRASQLAWQRSGTSNATITRAPTDGRPFVDDCIVARAELQFVAPGCCTAATQQSDHGRPCEWGRIAAKGGSRGPARNLASPGPR